MAKLVDVAQKLMDLYFQDYAPDDSFIGIDDFKFQIATAYSAILNALYQQQRKESKAQDGFSNIEIPAQWLVIERSKLSYEPKEGRYTANTKHDVYAFDFDNNANALQEVYPVGKGCRYRKISLSERKFLGIIPPTGVVFYYLNTKKEIVLCGAKEGAEVNIQYVPSLTGLDNDCLLSDGIISTLQPMVLEAMFKAKNGNFIQKLDNQNPNIVPGQQIDPAIK